MFANNKKKEEENSSSSSSSISSMDAVWMRRSFAICAMSALVVWAAVAGQEGRERAGGVRDAPEGTENSFQMEELARFAVAEHNKKENTLLEFSCVVKVREQVVAGMLYFLTVEAADSGTNKLYEAKVWVMPWMNFKQLTDFKLIENSGTVISQGP